MVESNGLQFADTIKVLYTLKTTHNSATLQETYDLLARDDLDTVLSVVRASYNAANNVTLNEEDFNKILEERKIGILKIIDLYGKIVQALLTNGLTEEEFNQRKNMLWGL